MYISKITLTNIRGFERLEFDLDRGEGRFAGWTVFTGDNGAGKSSLLKAIAIGLMGPEMARALQPSFHRWVREGSDKADINLGIMPVFDDDFLVGSGSYPYPWPASVPIKISLEKGDKDTRLSSPVPNGKPKNYITHYRGVWSQESPGWFSCGYGPFRRMFGASSDAMRQMVAPTSERFVTLFNESASLSEVDQWMRDLKFKAMMGRGQEEYSLELLLAFLSDRLLPDGISVDRVDADGLWLKDGQGTELPWSEMSDGYRAVLALVCDILRHMMNFHGPTGALIVKDQTGRFVIKRSGVILIDEIDAHLHPEWQRKIGFWLKERFPNIQFLVTSHSPLICQAADPNGIFVLPAPGSPDPPRALTGEEYQKVIASRPDTILLSPAFGLQNTRSPQVVAARAEWSRLQAKKQAGAPLTAEEEQRLSHLDTLVRTDEEL